jgi:hypothetical protein
LYIELLSGSCFAAVIHYSNPPEDATKGIVQRAKKRTGKGKPPAVNRMPINYNPAPSGCNPRMKIVTAT